LVYGILVLLDALGTKAGTKEDLKQKVSNFDLIDDRLNSDIMVLSQKLESRGYNHLIYSGTIYDNFQIFLPINIDHHKFVDMTGKNDWYWSLTIMGNLLIDFFRHAICHRIPLRGCITSGYGEISKTNRILGPIANEASRYYQIADWIGVILTNHPSIVLNNKVSVNPQKEFFEPYIKYGVPVKQCVPDYDSGTYRIEYKHKDFWTLRWPIQQGFEKIETEKLTYVFPSTKTEYGDIIQNNTIMQIIADCMNVPDPNASRKWKNTRNYFDSVKS
jgi:hypothetical protein